MTVERQYRGAIVIAPPGVIGEWGLQIIREAATLCNPPLQVHTLDRFDAVDLGLAPGGVFLTQFPSKSVQKVLDAGQLPIVTFIDDAQEAIAYLLRLTNCAFIDALRSTTCAAVINPELGRGLSTLVFRRADCPTASHVLERTLEHLALPISAAGKIALVEKYCSQDPGSDGIEASLLKCVAGYKPAGAAIDELTAEQLTITEQTLGSMVSMSVAGERLPITWASGLFLSGDRPNERAPLVVEMTGAARIIYYGPYLYLPPGNWEAEFAVGFSSDAIGSTFTVEVYSSQLLARARFGAKETGLFKGIFQFTHSTAQDHVELRFQSDQGAIEGKFGLAWVKFNALDESWLSQA